METTKNYGIVYVLRNSAMPDLVKIGMTNRDSVETRLKELYSTGVPVPFECLYACKVTDCASVEKALHTAFEPNRINPNREFFSIQPEQAIAILKLFGNDDITKEIEQEIDNSLKVGDRDAEKQLSRRPRFNLREMGIAPGATLVYTKSDGDPITATVIDSHKVDYQGQVKSLSAVTQELLGYTYPPQPTPYWTYNGKRLIDIYNDLYPTEE